MESKITRDQISEKEPFKYIKDDAKETAENIHLADLVLTDFTKSLKSFQTTAKDNLAAIKEQSAANRTLAAAYAKVIEIEKVKLAIGEKDYKQAIVDSILKEQQSKQRQAELKEKQALSRESEKQQKIIDKEQKAIQSKGDRYGRLNKMLNDVRKEYRSLAISQELNGKLDAKQIERLELLRGRIEKLDGAFKKVDRSMGIHTREVGNYENATKNLNLAFAQVGREIPAFANSLQTGFMAISNNLPAIKDGISQLIEKNKELAAQGKQTVNILGAIRKAVFSWEIAMSAGIALLTIYGEDAVKAIGNLFTETEKLTVQEKKLQQEAKKQAEFIGDESSAYVGLIMQLKHTNEGSREREDLIKKINKEYGTTLQNLSDEKKFQEQLNQSVKDYISYKEQEFRIKINEDLIAKGLAKQREIKRDIYETDRKISEIRAKNKEIDPLNVIPEVSNPYIQTELQNFTKYREDQLILLNELNERLKKYGLNIGEATSKMDELGFSTEKAGKKTKELEDFSRQIEEETNKRLYNEIQLEIANIRTRLKFEKQAIEEAYADRKQKIELIELLELNAAAEVQKITDEILLKRFEKELELSKAAADAKLEAQKKIGEQMLKDLDEIEKAEEEFRRRQELGDEISVIRGEKTQKQVLENKIARLEEEYKKEKDGSTRKLELDKEIAVLQKELADNLAKEEEDRNKKRYDALNAAEKEVETLLEANLNKRIGLYSTELEARRKHESQLEELAKNGRIRQDESLALERSKIAKAEAERMKLEERLAKIKLLIAAIEGYSKTGNVGKAIGDIALIKGAIDKLPSFKKGTRSTGKRKDKGIDGEGGFLSVLHENEMVMPEKDTKKIPSYMSVSDVADLAFKFDKGEIVQKNTTSDHSGNSYSMMLEMMEKISNSVKEIPKNDFAQLSHDMGLLTSTVKRNGITIENKFLTKWK